MAVVTMKQLLESGVHFGHQTRRWNPKMKKYIYTKRNGIHIIDLQKTVSYIEDAYKRFLEMGKEGKKVLFVGTKKQAADAIKEHATRAGHFYVTKRWLGGTLTNFKTIRRSIRRLHSIKKWEVDGTFERLPKKETVDLRKELDRLEMFLGGIKDMRTLPDALFIVDTRKEHNAVHEANKLGIPIFAMVDSNSDPDPIDHLIPANDDAIRSIKLITKTLADALIEGAGGQSEAETETESEKQTKETVEKKKEDLKRKVDTEQQAKRKSESSKAEQAPRADRSQAKPTETKREQPAKGKEQAQQPAQEQAKQEAPAKPQADLESLTVPELRQLAKQKGMSGYSKLRKAELIDALKKQ